MMAVDTRFFFSGNYNVKKEARFYTIFFISILLNVKTRIDCSSYKA